MRSVSAATMLAVVTLCAPARAADPQLASWFTAGSGLYARIYSTDADKTNGVTATTWSNGTQTQSTPAYRGVQEVYSSADWVYLRTTGLGQHIMGPWYNNTARTVAFVNLPANQKALYRIPRTPTLGAPPAVKTPTFGAVDVIGYFVDGVAMYDALDGFVWLGSSEGNGNGQWRRAAYPNEGLTFDPSYTHQQNTGVYHNHANPIALRYLLGDHVDFNPVSKIYTESTNAVMRHSPILGWVRDGLPFYGPYGFANATNPAGGVRRMVSGYVLRNGQNGTDNLTATGRGSLPAWTLRNNGSTAATGPGVNTTYPLGRYLQDYAYLGDLVNAATGSNYVLGTHFDLNEFSARYCVTPEFTNGTWAYFLNIDSNGTPVAPWVVGQFFMGNPTGTKWTNITESVTTNILAGPSAPLQFTGITPDAAAVTLVWSSVDGGTYEVQTNNSLASTSWVASASVASQGVATQTNAAAGGDAVFFRLRLASLAAFDPVNGSAGGGTTAIAPGGSAARGTTVTVTITLPSTPPQPPVSAIPTSVTLAGTISGTAISRPSQETVQVTFTIPGNAATGAQNIVVTFSPMPVYTMTGAFTVN
ncbi:MAG: YHYH protein [Verrucomicrobia bacterium]|nr:YHYH protein [Verrucomicrobiota bacterium]